MAAWYKCSGSITLKNTPEIDARVKAIEKLLADIFLDGDNMSETIVDGTSIILEINAAGDATYDETETLEEAVKTLNDDTLDEAGAFFFQFDDSPEYEIYVGSEQQRALAASKAACSEAIDAITKATDASHLAEIQRALDLRRTLIGV